MNKARLIASDVLCGGASDPYPGVTVYDSFTDADDTALTAHVPEKIPDGQVWTAVSGTMDIQGNQAAWLATALNVQVIDTGLADCTLSCLLTTIDGGANDQLGISFRVTNTANRLLCYIDNQTNNIVVIKFESSSPTVLGFAAIALANTTQYAMEVILSGDSIIAKLDGVQKVSVTNSYLANNTKHGLYAQRAGHKFDEFQVV